jgi:hypothetical protein
MDGAAATAGLAGAHDLPRSKVKITRNIPARSVRYRT